MPSSSHDSYYKGLQQLEGQGLSTRVANDVMYLRTQAGHTTAREERFISEAKAGSIPDVTTFAK